MVMDIKDRGYLFVPVEGSESIAILWYADSVIFIESDGFKKWNGLLSLDHYSGPGIKVVSDFLAKHDLIHW